jgi:RimJ/RimL family protein N-acetyltransferase
MTPRAGLAVFRLDARPGATARCGAFATELAALGWIVRAAVDAGATAAFDATALTMPEPAAADAAVLRRAEPDSCALLVVDHRGRDRSYDRALAGWAARRLVFDDRGDAGRAVDVILDPPPGSGSAERRSPGPAFAPPASGFARRLVCVLADSIALADGGDVALRPADADDRQRLLAWQREPGARRWSRDPEIPDEARHAGWLAETLADPARRLFIVERDREPVGSLRLDRLKPDGFEVSIVIGTAARRRGVGRAALALLRRLAPSVDLLAAIDPRNEASRRLFAAAGYRDEGDGRHLLPAPTAPGAGRRPGTRFTRP